MRYTLKNHQEVCHYWANKTQESGRASNMFFENGIIYSYGHHFSIAKHANIKGEDVVLFTTRGYSSSTSKHLSYARQACSHLNVIDVGNVEARTKEDHLANVEERMDEITSLLGKAKRATVYKDMHNSAVLRIADGMKQYVKLFLPRHKFDFADLESVAKQREEIERKAQATRKREDAVKLKEYLAKVEDWKGDPTVRLPYTSIRDVGIFLRVNGDNVETSQGATVPKHQAKLFIKLCQACRKAGEGLNTFVHKVGVYTPSSIDAKGNAVVGCHKLSFSELDCISELL